MYLWDWDISKKHAMTTDPRGGASHTKKPLKTPIRHTPANNIIRDCKETES